MTFKWFSYDLEKAYSLDTTLARSDDLITLIDGEIQEPLLSRRRIFRGTFKRQLAVDIKYAGDEEGALQKTVYFRSPVPVDITTSFSEQWNCGQKYENQGCSKLRQGILMWSTEYTITFLGKQRLQCTFYNEKYQLSGRGYFPEFNILCFRSYVYDEVDMFKQWKSKCLPWNTLRCWWKDTTIGIRPTVFNLSLQKVLEKLRIVSKWCLG